MKYWAFLPVNNVQNMFRDIEFNVWFKAFHSTSDLDKTLSLWLKQSPKCVHTDNNENLYDEVKHSQPVELFPNGSFPTYGSVTGCIRDFVIVTGRKWSFVLVLVLVVLATKVINIILKSQNYKSDKVDILKSICEGTESFHVFIID